MGTSAYEPPKSDLLMPSQVEIHEEISKKIKHGWIAAIIFGVITLGRMLLAMNTDAREDIIVGIWTSAEVVLVFLLAFGIYKKSRFAATFMFAYFLLPKIWMVYVTGSLGGITISIALAYFYFQAMIGTYKYHKLVNKRMA